MFPSGVRITLARGTVATAHRVSYRSASSLTIVLKPEELYSTNELTRQQCIQRALEEWKHLGFKKEGACHIEIIGGFHHHEKDDKSGEWLTVVYRDRGDRVFRHEKADGSVWDRVHVYRDAELNASEGEKPKKIWLKTEVSVSKRQLNMKT